MHSGHMLIIIIIAIIATGNKLESPGQSQSQLENCLYQTGLEVCLWGIFLIVNW